MRYLPAIICVALCPGAFAQYASVDAIGALGYLYPQPAPVAPGQLITVFLTGSIQGTITAAVQQAASNPAPVLELRPSQVCPFTSSGSCAGYTAITIQIPYEMVPACFPCALATPSPTQLSVSVNGATAAAFDLTPLSDHVHILTACDVAVPGGDGDAPLFGVPCSPLVTHADGSLVSNQNPAQIGEVLVAYAVGLGHTTPAVATGQAATTATPTSEVFYLDFNFRLNSLATQPNQALALYPLYSGLAPGYPGLYQVNFIVPPPPAGTALQPCYNSNLTVSVGGQESFDGAGICVATQ